MGNQLAPASKQGVETQGELLNVVVKETLGGGRFLKSLLCLHDNGGLVVVKVFYKRKDATSLVPYKHQLQTIRDALLGLQCPHVWPMQLWWETPNAAYMMRQHFFANLYDRLSTRPFLTGLEKRWITFQLLHGLSQAHAHGVCHGDIKCENVMVTSWNWLFLTDFASYKPTYLPADNPADFSYYFDTGSRRRCYLAPERFFEGSAAAINAAAPLAPDMDVFSLGCVIAELWLDGRAFFDLSRLLAYRRGEYDPTAALAGVEPDIAELIMHMIQRSPGERWSADHYLTSWPRRLFPQHFSDVLHPFFNALLELDPDARLAAVAAQYGQLEAAIVGSSGSSTAAVEGGVAAEPQVALEAGHAPAAAPAATTPQPSAAAAAAGTAASGPAGPAAAVAAAGSELLAEVTSLLADVSCVQRRLVGAAGGIATAAEDDGICIDEPTSLIGQDSSLLAQQLDAGPTAAGPAVGAAASELQAVTEEWYEYQVRDPSNQWVPGAPGTSGRPARKEDVALPAAGSWQWLGDWQLQLQPCGTSSSQEEAAAAAAEGWQYATSDHQPPDDGWGSTCTDQAQQRRRRWVRLHATKAISGGSAATTAAASASAGKAVGPVGTELLPVRAAGAAGASSSNAGRDQGMVLVAVLLCTLLRGSKLQESKRAAIILLFRCGLLCDDEVRLQSIVPYLLTQLADPAASVRTLALRCVVQVMASLSKLPPADAKVYHDYLLPSLSLLPHDPEESVRVAYALAVAHLAAAAHEHLLGMQYGSSGGSSNNLTAGAAATAGGNADAAGAVGVRQLVGQRSSIARGSSSGGTAADGAASGAVEEDSEAAASTSLTSAADADGSQVAAAAAAHPLVRYDAEMAAVRGAVEHVVQELVAGTRSSADINRALLSHAHQLGLFFGRRGISEVLLPLLITCLNAGEWQLRSNFYGAIADVGPHTGRDSLEAFWQPCLHAALGDSETAVVCDAVRCLAATCGHLRKRSLLEAARKVAPLLHHSSAAVRHSAVAFIAAAARSLPPADVYTQLCQMVRGFLQQQPLMLADEEHLAACLHPCCGSETATAATANTPASSSTLQQQPLQKQTSPLRPLGTSSSINSIQELPSTSVTGFSPLGPRRTTADRAVGGGGWVQQGQGQAGGGAEVGVGRGREHGSFGTLLSPPEAVRRTMSGKAGDRAGGPLSLGSTAPSPLSPRVRDSELNLEGSQLMLRPSAPVYCLDIDSAALSSTTSTTEAAAAGAGAGGIAGAQSAATSAITGAAGAATDTAAGGSAGLMVRAGSRRGYRLAGFSAAGGGAPPSGDAAKASANSLPQNATVAPGLLATARCAAAGAGAAAATAPGGTAAAACSPGNFWPGPSAGLAGVGAAAGLLTGMSNSLGVGPGGLLVGPTAAGNNAGLRPRPKSSHTAAVESISRRHAALQERYAALSEALARDPAGLEAGDRQQLERLAATLHRLQLQPGNDVRCPAALITYKMAAITSRAGPAGAAPGAAGDPSTSAPAVFDAVSAAISTGIGQHLPGPGALEGAAGVSGTAAGAGGPSWRPRGVLASHLMEHRAAVNCLATSANGALLLSGSDDETVKVWDIRRLERDVSFASRLTYAGQSGRITGLCPVLDGCSIASASASGSLHVWRVEYTSKPGGWAPDKYRGITAVRQLSPGEGSILSVVPWGGHPALLLYASQRGGVHCCDLRCPADAWHVPSTPSLGLAQQLVADPSGQHWLAQGTSRGWVCLWDVRFLLCVNSWQHPQRCGIDAMSLAVAAPPRLGLSQGSLPHPGVPLLYMSAGLQEVGLWDVLDGRCHQVLRVLDRQESQLATAGPPAALQPPLPQAAASSTPTSKLNVSGWAAATGSLGLQQRLPPGVAAAGGADAAGLSGSPPGGSSSAVHHSIDVNQLANELSTHLAIDQINSPQARLAGVTALLPLPGGALLTGGADRCVRYWDGSWPERSYVVSGPVWPDDTGIMDPNTNKLQVPCHAYRYSKHMLGGVPVLEERCVGEGPRLVTPDSSPDLGSKLRMHELVHADGITQLLAVDGASKLLLSASRDGCIKVWK